MNLRQRKLYTEDLETTLAHAVDIEKLYGKKVLITGATGTIGSFAADALIHLNQKVKANIRVLLAGRSVEKLQNQFGNHDNVKYLSYDLNAPIEFDDLQVRCTDKETFLLMLLMRHIQDTLIFCQLGRAIH